MYVTISDSFACLLRAARNERYTRPIERPPIEPLPHHERPRQRVWPALLLIAIAVTVLNALKPLTMDDSAYAEYAQQIARHPLDPYGFQVFWSQWPEPANWLLAPPALLYWWAIAIRFFGPSVFVWKLWLLPWIAAFVFAVHALLKRFAPAVALPITVFTVFAPIYLPAINYMLDVPALGLGLLALVVSMRAIDRRSVALVVLSGILFGVALQTKYTVLTLPMLAAVYGFSRRRFVTALVPGVIALAVFAAWELLVAHRYGRSHFMLHLHGPDLLEGKDPRYFLIVGGITLMGGLAGPLALLMLFALGATPRWLAGGAAVVVGAIVATAVVPLGMPIYGGLGIGIWAVIGVALWALIRRRGDAVVRRDDGYLLAWFAVESIAFCTISPFTATRRLMGLMLILTLIAGRLLNGRVETPDAVRTLRHLVSFGVILGLLFFVVDWIDARAQQHAAEAAVAVIDAGRKPGQQAYYKGHWGLQFYCERLGLKPIVPDHTPLRPGDWFVYPHSAINSQMAALPLADADERATIVIDDALPLEMVPAFYGRLVALDHRTGPRLSLSVFQMKTPFVPPTSFLPEYVIRWAITRPLPLMPLAVTAVLRDMKSVDHEAQKSAARKIIEGGADTLIEASRDEDSRSRRWAAVQLGKLPTTPAITAALQKELSDPEPAVRAAAAKALNTSNANAPAKSDVPSTLQSGRPTTGVE